VVTEARDATPLVRHLTLRTDDGAPYVHLPGQWVKVYLPGGLDRDYSIASAPSAALPSQIELVITRVEGGAGSNALHAIDVGAGLDTLGPNGLFVREDAHRAHPALYVGTGTGLAPLRAMMQDELASPSGQPQVLLFGARQERDLLFGSELQGWADAGRIRYVPTLSQAEPSWTGRRGYVQRHLAEVVAELPGVHVYICGLSRMITEVRAVLRGELGLDRKQVHSERYD
jgi:NAD(P)H-flavin reductase